MNKHSQVVRAIEQDIRVRGLKAGDLYQSARELAQNLGVSAMTADRAMQKLVVNGLLCRRIGSGTYVGERVGTLSRDLPRAVQVWVPSSFYTLYTAVVETIVKALHLEFPENTIHHVFLPEEDHQGYAQRQVSNWEDRSRPEMVVLIACSQSVQCLMKSQGVPVLATGGVNPGTCEIPWIDMDYRESGRLVAENALQNGHTRILVLMNRIWGAGDTEFIEGIKGALVAFKGKKPETRCQILDLEPSEVSSHLRRALRGRNAPSAVICSSKVAALEAIRVGQESGLRTPEEFLVSTVRVRAPQAFGCRYAYTRWADQRASQDALHRIIQHSRHQPQSEPHSFLIPVELVTPDPLGLWI